MSQDIDSLREYTAFGAEVDLKSLENIACLDVRLPKDLRSDIRKLIKSCLDSFQDISNAAVNYDVVPCEFHRLEDCENLADKAIEDIFSTLDAIEGEG